MLQKILIQAEKHKTQLFVLFLVGLYFLLNYHHILFYGPQGIHFTRQTDSLSFASNYFHNGFQFFEPQVYNLNSLFGKAACEFPILYYLTALLYLLVGEKEFVLRFITLSIVSIGFIYLFKLLVFLLKDSFYAFVFSLIFMSSAILLYYANNFLPDASAFGFCLIGWYFYFDFQQNTRQRSLLFFNLFFLLAALLKVTYFINPLAAILSLLILNYTKKKGFKNFFSNNKLSLLLFVSISTFILAWNLYIIHYNQINHDSYFLTHIRPIWSLQQQEIESVWDHISRYWYSKYYYQSTFHVFLLIIILGFIFVRKRENPIFIPALLLSFGGISFILLFYAQFQDHDYYFITLIPPLILLIISSFVALKNKFPKLCNHLIIKAIMLLISILSFNYGRKKLEQRYADTKQEEILLTKNLSQTGIDLEKMGMPKKAIFIVVGDATPNASLYFLKHQGWTLPNCSEKNKTKFENYIKMGADYALFTKAGLAPFKVPGKCISSKNGMLIYKLDPKT